MKRRELHHGPIAEAVPGSPLAPNVFERLQRVPNVF